MKDTELLAQIAQDVLCDGGQFQLNSTQLNAFDLALRKTDHSRDATRDADTELGQQTAQCVNELGPLPNNQGPSPVQGSESLLINRFNFNKLPSHGLQTNNCRVRIVWRVIEPDRV
ncbi:MAG: hypothetical protein ACI9ND_002441 [Yoonia sp.]|jgi:hypothetical protein